MYDTIIIGAGMSGLAAGIRLAHFGQRVCILERHSAIGGLNSFYRQRRPHARRRPARHHQLCAPRARDTGPMARLLRQLRIAWDEWALAPQLGSAIIFPDATLRFSNDFALLESEIRWRFPRQIDNFRRLVACAARLRPVWQVRSVTRSAREGGRARSSTIRCWSRCSSAPSFSTAAARERHGLRPVQHPLPRDLSGGACPAAGWHPEDSQNAGPPFPGPWRRVSAARGRREDRRQATMRSRKSCWRTARNSKRATCFPRPGWTGDHAALRRPAIRTKLAPAGCRLSSRFRSSTAQPRPSATTRRLSSTMIRRSLPL